MVKSGAAAPTSRGLGSSGGAAAGCCAASDTASGVASAASIRLRISACLGMRVQEYTSFMRLHVGTSGYNFPEWKGTFYPEKIKPPAMLPYYAGRLSTVEINYTFYRMPNPKTVAGWDAAVPAAFTFVLKAPQRITHIGRLKNIDDSLRYFTETVRPLGAKLGPI